MEGTNSIVNREKPSGMTENRLSGILRASLIKATDTYQMPPEIIWVEKMICYVCIMTIRLFGNVSRRRTMIVCAIGFPIIFMMVLMQVPLKFISTLSILKSQKSRLKKPAFLFLRYLIFCRQAYLTYPKHLTCT